MCVRIQPVAKWMELLTFVKRNNQFGKLAFFHLKGTMDSFCIPTAFPLLSISLWFFNKSFSLTSFAQFLSFSPSLSPFFSSKTPFPSQFSYQHEAYVKNLMIRLVKWK